METLNGDARYPCFIALRVRLSQHYSYTHLSAGDLLRKERSRTDSEFSQIIDSCFKRGEFAPVEITITLLRKVCSLRVSDTNLELISTFSVSVCKHSLLHIQAII